MTGQPKPFDVNLYRAILAQKNMEDVYQTVDTQRKCAVLSFDEACKSLDNASACELLSHNLKNYTDSVCQGGNNIYNDLLHKTHPDLAIRRQFKVPNSLPKTDLSVYMNNMPCSENDNKLRCIQSEQISKAELDQFNEVYLSKKSHNYMEDKSVKWSNKRRNVLSLEERFKNLDKLQGKYTHDKSYDQPVAPADITSKVGKKEPNFNFPAFSTARDELENQMSNQAGNNMRQYSDDNIQKEGKKRLGSRRTAKSKFVCPLLSSKSSEEKIETIDSPAMVDERLKNIEPKMVELIMAEIMDKGPKITWNDIAGLQFAKAAIKEAVVWPLLRPDIFTGLRRPPKGILLFGPPGTGKTLIGKCVASQSKSTFFSISASSLTSKWIGDGEKMVRALFQVARVHQPAVIFIDEVDSLLTQRSDTEHESSRRIKTEFLVQLDGATTDSEERLLVIGATNRPQELDEAARRRFVKRLYIPLPEFDARVDLLKRLMSTERHSLTEENFNEIAQLADGYSGADIKNLCSDAALEPIRSIDFSQIEDIHASQVRSLAMEDFGKALRRVRPSVSQTDLVQYLTWDKTYGSGTNSV